MLSTSYSLSNTHSVCNEMPGDRFEFDENGDTFFCFLASFYTIVLIPVTYFCWPSFDNRDFYDQGKRKCMCQPCQVKRHNLKSSTPLKKIKRLSVKGGFVLAWIIFLLLIYKLTLMKPVEAGFDPFAQLEISKDASLSEVRRAYKQLSVKYHPDKGGDPKRFILISKAYAALTNEESRKNWEEYGNPDGPGVAHFGIALPRWMVRKENFYLVIGAYIFLFMLLLPIAVGTWWYNTMKFSTNNVLLDTVRCFCGSFMRSPYMAMPRVIKVLSSAYEFNPSCNKEIACRPSDNVELPPLIMQIPIFTIFKKAIVGSPSSVKARALIYAHLERIDLPPKTLHLDRQYIVKNCPRLIDEMINSLLYVLAVAMDEVGSRHKMPQHLATIENCMHLVPMLIQALSDSASPLLQLPHIGSSQLRHMAAKQRNIKSIRQLVRLPDDKRRSLLRSLSDEQYRDVLNVCASIPVLEIGYRCEVLDEEDPSIWPFSMVTATILLTRHPLFEPTAFANTSSVAATSVVVGTSTLPEVHYAGSGRTDWSAYENSSSQLYPAADINLDSGPMDYGDFGDEDNDQYNSKSGKLRKSTTPVWDKSKRKKPVRKTKQRKQEQWKLQRAENPAGDKIRPAQPGKNELFEEQDSDVEAPELLLDPDDASSITGPPNPVTDNGEFEDITGFQTVTNDSVVHTTDRTSEPKGSFDCCASDGDRIPPKSSSESRSSSDSKPHCTHLVHCPFFPVEKFEGWWVYLVDRKTRQLVTRPVYVATLQTVEEVPLRFVAPSVPGSYIYTLYVRSDSYVDCDFSETIRFSVSPLPDRIVHYLKEQEEAQTDSSASSYGDSDDEGDLADEPSENDDDAVDEKLNADTSDMDEENGVIDEERLFAYLAKA